MGVAASLQDDVVGDEGDTVSGFGASAAMVVFALDEIARLTVLYASYIALPGIYFPLSLYICMLFPLIILLVPFIFLLCCCNVVVVSHDVHAQFPPLVPLRIYPHI